MKIFIYIFIIFHFNIFANEDKIFYSTNEIEENFEISKIFQDYYPKSKLNSFFKELLIKDDKNCNNVNNEVICELNKKKLYDLIFSIKDIFNINMYLKDIDIQQASIGVKLEKNDVGYRIAYIYNNSSAFDKLKINDILIAINNIETKNLNIQSVLSLLQGKENTVCLITIERNNEILNKTIKRINNENISKFIKQEIYEDKKIVNKKEIIEKIIKLSIEKININNNLKFDTINQIKQTLNNLEYNKIIIDFTWLIEEELNEKDILNFLSLFLPKNTCILNLKNNENIKGTKICISNKNEPIIKNKQIEIIISNKTHIIGLLISKILKDNLKNVLINGKLNIEEKKFDLIKTNKLTNKYYEYIYKYKTGELEF